MKIINNITGKNMNKTNIPQKLEIKTNNVVKVIDSLADISTNFNEYFVGVGRGLSEKIINSPCHLSYLGQSQDNTFFLHPTT